MLTKFEKSLSETTAPKSFFVGVSISDRRTTFYRTTNRYSRDSEISLFGSLCKDINNILL